MRFTQGQIMRLTGISRDALRHWRSVFPALGARQGRREQFTGGDALALCVIERLVRVAHLQVAGLAPIAEALFAACQGPRWTQLAGQLLCIDLNSGRVFLIPEMPKKPPESLLIVMRVDDLIEEIQRRLLGDESGESGVLLFKPLGLPSAKGQA